VLAAATLAFVPSASATTEIAADPDGDSTNPYADIISVGGTYTETAIAVSVNTVLAADPAYWDDANVIIWEIDTNGDGVEDFSVFYDNTSNRVRRSSDFALMCYGTEGYDGDLYITAFSASCIGSPGSFRVRAYMKIFTGAYDFAPSYNTFTPWIYRDVPPPPQPQPEPQPTPQPPPPPPPPPPVQPDPEFTTAGDESGYWMITADGTVYPFGDAKNLGSQATSAADIEPTPSGDGYWILSANGEVFTKGDARYFGNATLAPGEEATSLSATPNGDGYWVFTNKGRVIGLGAAPFKGDMSGVALNGPVLDSVATPSGQGYYMVASDGGIFSFGDAKFSGSMGGTKLNQPVVSMAPDPDGDGYWLVAADGGIFAFGSPFYGSTGSLRLNKPITGMVTGPAGYLMVAEDGGIFAFGDVKFHGSLGSNPPASPVVAVALLS
ncbi:MAG: hypothetical protein ACRDZ3_04715, partial [Acidimicrobiia bacterium]